MHGVRKTLTSCQQNPILFGRAGLTTPTRLGFLFRLTFPVTSRRNSNYDSNTKCKGRRYSSNDLSRCRLHPDSDAINSIITQKQLYLTRKTARTSGTVPGEHTVGQTQLMVRLAVSSQRTASRSGWDLLYGFMMSLWHEEMMCFTSQCQQRHFEHSNRCCGHRELKPRKLKGGGMVAKSGGTL